MGDLLKGASPAGDGNTSAVIPNENIKKWNLMRQQDTKTALDDYMSGGPAETPVIDYEYKKFVPPGEVVGNPIENPPPDEQDPHADLVNDDGTPMPGHPDYVAWMQSGGEGLPDHADKGVKSFEDMMSDGSYMKATNLYEKLNFLPIFNMAHKMNMKQLAKEGLIDTGSVPNITNEAENTAAVNAMDKYGGFTGSNVKDVAASFSKNADGDSMAGGYSDGGPSAGQASGAEEYGGASYGGHGEISGLNYGGPVSGSYSHGGTPHGDDWKKPKPLAKPRKDESSSNAQRVQLDTQDERKRGALTQMLMSVGTAAAVGKVANSGMVGVGYNKGGTMCPCGTPGCPGCGKGYNSGGTPDLSDNYYRGVSRPTYDARFINPSNSTDVYPPSYYRGLQYNRDKDAITNKYHRGTHMFKDDTYAGGASGPLAMSDRNAQYAKYVDDINALKEQGTAAQNNRTFGQTYRADSPFAKGPSADSSFGQMVTGYKEQVPNKNWWQTKKSYKEEIARNESDAKIRREDAKALATIKSKIKGPLQQGE